MHVSVLHLISVLALLFAASGAMKEQAGRGPGKPLTPEDTIQDLLNHPAFADRPARIFHLRLGPRP